MKPFQNDQLKLHVTGCRFQLPAIPQNSNKGIGDGVKSLSGADLESGEEFFSRYCGNPRIGVSFVEENGLLQAVEVHCAVRTTPQVFPDFPAVGGA